MADVGVCVTDSCTARPAVRSETPTVGAPLGDAAALASVRPTRVATVGTATHAAGNPRTPSILQAARLPSCSRTANPYISTPRPLNVPEGTDHLRVAKHGREMDRSLRRTLRAADVASRSES